MPNKKPPAQINPPEPADPYKMRTLEQILSLFDGGEFIENLMSDHRKLQTDLLEHHAEHGSKAKGTMTIQVTYNLGRSGDVGMGATATFKSPQKPASSAAAFINDNGELTLYSPMMTRMHGGVRDATHYDPETGEIRDI